MRKVLKGSQNDVRFRCKIKTNKKQTKTKCDKSVALDSPKDPTPCRGARRKERSTHNALGPTILSAVVVHVISNLDLNELNIV